MVKLAIQDDNHRVTIRVWSANIRYGEVGHASLQTYGDEGIHASFWPRRNPRNGNPGFLRLRNVHEITSATYKFTYC